MAVYVWKPRLLAAVVTVLAAGAGTAAVIATTGDGGEEAPGIEVPASEQTFYPSEEELEKIRAIIDADGRVAKVNGGQPYEIVLAVGVERSDGNKRVEVEVVWDKPVTSRGPWASLACRGLVLVEGEATWKNLRSVAIDLDLERGVVTELAPGYWALKHGAEIEVSEDDWDSMRVIEQPAGWNLKEGAGFSCPEGYADEPQ